MIRFQNPLTAETYILNFYHGGKFKKYEGSQPTPRFTVAVIKDTKDRVLFEAEARLHHTDTFSYREGRRAAMGKLANTLYNNGHSRSFVKAMYNAYAESGAKI